MSVSLAEVRQRCRRTNHEDNLRTMFFSSRVSVYITFVLTKTGITADSITCVFAVLGIISAAANYLPFFWAPFLGFVLYRIHVILDVVDGEMARFRGTCSRRGAYLDYITHYLVYAAMAFGCSINAYLLLGSGRMLIYGFAISMGLVMNLASKDCWYRANYGGNSQIEANKPIWKYKNSTLLLVRLFSVNTFWFVYALAAILDYYLAAGTFQSGVLFAYALLMPAFAVLRAAVTFKSGLIPRRAAWYK